MIYKKYILFHFALLAIACKGGHHDLKIEKGNGFIADQYIAQMPLAKITGLGNYSLETDSFILHDKGTVQIYSVGEILYNLADREKRYFLKDDNIELFLKPSRQEESKKFTLTYTGDFSKFKECGGSFKWKNVDSKQYHSTIFIPWHILEKDIPKIGDTVKFDIAIGDNDDGYIQEKKIAWSSKSEMELSDTKYYGNIMLSERNMLPDTFASIETEDKLSASEKSTWHTQNSIKIEKSLLGHIKDKFDLSGEMKFCWNRHGIYIHVIVRDSRQKKLPREKIPERNIFTDIAWVENKQKNKVWEMDARKSVWAGGALKNQKEEARLELPAGEYYVFYKTDESHAIDAWDSAPPKTPFYGIIVYDWKAGKITK